MHRVNGAQGNNGFVTDIADLTDLVIRPEVPGDHAAIHELVAAAFGSEVEAELVQRIRESAGYRADLALVAEIDRSVVGHVMVSTATLAHEAGERDVAMLSPLAVAPSTQKLGVGAALVAAVAEIANDAGEPFIVLEGSPVYYGRLGFEPAAKYGISMPIPSWAPPEAAQLLALDSFDRDDPTARGAVIYPSPFDGLD